MRATCDASRPRTCPEASTTYHLRAISPALGKYAQFPPLWGNRLTLLISQKNENRRRPLSTHQSAEGAWLSGGQPQLPKTLRYRRKCCIVNEQTGETGYFFSVFFDELDSDFDESDPDSALGLLSFFASESLPESLFDSEPELEADPPAGFLA